MGAFDKLYGLYLNIKDTFDMLLFCLLLTVHANQIRWPIMWPSFWAYLNMLGAWGWRGWRGWGGGGVMLERGNKGEISAWWGSIALRPPLLQPLFTICMKAQCWLITNQRDEETASCSAYHGCLRIHSRAHSLTHTRAHKRSVLKTPRETSVIASS